MKMPPLEQIGIALDWLRSNEGDNGESDACQAVADWLEHQETERQLRGAARSGGVPVAALRRKLKENAAS
jgi:hypothetical protein